MGQDYQIRRGETGYGREIKDSAHYTYVSSGITLDGSKFALGELVLEGQALVRDKVTGKFEKYTETTGGTFEAGKDFPVILDESVKFNPTDSGVNPDTTVGQVLVHGTVHAGMCKGVTDAFKKELTGAVRFV